MVAVLATHFSSLVLIYQSLRESAGYLARPMIMVSTLLASMLFKEAKPADLSQIATMLAEKSKRPSMVISAGKTEFDVDAGVSDPDSFCDPMIRLGSILLRSDLSVLRPTILPEANWGILKSLVGGSAGPKVTEESIPGEAMKGGKLKFTSAKGTVVNLRSIAALKFDKKIQLAGYFEGSQSSPFKVALCVPGEVDGVVFAQALATGLGGKYRVTEKVWFVDFDSATWRRGFASLLAKSRDAVQKGGVISTQPQYDPSNPGGDFQRQMPSQSQTSLSRSAALNLLNQVVVAMSDSLVEQTFAFPNTTTRLNLNNYPGLKRFIGDYIRTVLPKESKGATVSRGGGQGLPSNLLERIDANRPGELVIESNFRLSVELNLGRSSGGEEGRQQRIQIL